MIMLRRAGIAFGVVGFLICLILLLNFTAPNPTGRRYSSESPLTGRDIRDSQAIGSSGEAILSRDLRMANNNDPFQRQCLCDVNFTFTSGVPSECRVCITYTPLISGGGYRIPDFVGANFIAESKNRENWLYSYQDQADQIQDYANGAIALGIPLWIYVRTDTLLSPDFVRLAESTGGGIVYYFTVDGYVDTVDQVAGVGLRVSVIILLLCTGWELLARGLQTEKPKSPRGASIDTLATFVENSKEQYRQRIDREDASQDQHPPNG